MKMRARKCDGSISIWDRVRKSYIVLTPEEWVRQHLIEFLISHLSLSEPQIIIEYPVQLNGQNQRADVVVVGQGGRPWILVECKAPEVAIEQSTLDQAVRYNSIVAAQYIILTNGLTHHLYRRVDDEGHYEVISSWEQIRN